MTTLNEVSPSSTRVGWIGTGVMGASMCRHLLEAGYAASVYSRTRSKADGLIDAGATWADSPGDVARASDVVFTMLGFPGDVREVMLGSQGVVAAAPEGAIIVDMS